MQIAVIADDGEVIDSVDFERKELQRVLTGHYSAKTVLALSLDTQPIRRFLGMWEKVPR